LRAARAPSKLASHDREVHSRICAIIRDMRKSGPRSIGGNQLDGLPPLREVAAAHGLLAKKSLGQNFLFDFNLTRRIARAAAPLTNTTIVEIGPGPGGLTRALLAEGAQKVIAVERDVRCLAALAGIAHHYPGRLEIIEGDALEVDLGPLVGEAKPARVCANLPYNIATALLVRWLETEPWPPWFDRLTLMFQREVAERIVASTAERAAYGRLAVLCNWRCETRILFDVAASAFTPPPKVTSTLVELVPRPAPVPFEARLLSEVTQAAFGQRRKMLRQSLKSLGGGDAGPLLASAGIDPALRAEEIGVEGFAALARALGNVRAGHSKP
jgi:16S rRNA (adenine1518-N6/adenine1519-N6)-dimethyltransferase